MKDKSKTNKSLLKMSSSTNNYNPSDMLILIKNKLSYIQTIIQNTTLSIYNYKKYEIFSNSDVTICIASLHELYEKTLHMLQIISSYNPEELQTNDINILIDSLQKIIDKLSIIISSFGTKNIDDLIYVTFGNDYLKSEIKDPILKSKYDLILNYLHPVGYKIINWKSQKSIKPNDTNSYCENKILDEIMNLENFQSYECFDIDSSNKSFYFKVNGIQVIFHNENTKKTLVVNCISDNIILDFLSNKYIDTRIKQIKESISDSFDSGITKRLIESSTLKDILIYGNNDYYKKCLSIQSDVNSLKYNKLDITIKKFLEMELYLQRNMLINLLIYNKEPDIHYITYLLYDLITISNNESLDSNEQRMIYDSFPWKIKNYFKDTMQITVKFSQEMSSKYEINKISLEQQIYLLKAPENVKEKAMIKMKEIKGKTDDTSIKAKQYLEGLLKIPFGVYKKEPILKVIKEINGKFTSILNRNLLIETICNIEKKETYTKMEIIQHIETIEKQIEQNFLNEIKKVISSSTTKDLSNIIHYIQNIHKNGAEIQDVNSLTSLLKTKPQKIQSILNIIEKNNTPEILPQFYKIYDLLPNESNTIISKTPTELKELKTNILNTENILSSVSNILDESIYGHTHAKNQILKIIGQWMTGEQSGYCFGFEGSPGIGKTSLAKKGLSNCLKDENGVSRPFAFIALGGSCNGSTLEGHSYTYVNSTWGRIVDILMETKCMNPIIYVDELDKVSKTEHGKEIIGILTHLIDTTQNDVFQDKYYSGIDIDLSKALFIFSYNDPEQIDRILLDRIHRIRFDNLSLEDKLVVVNKHIIPDINKKMGLENSIILEPTTIEYIIEKYTLEPGVRKLKEVLFDLYGEINIQMLKGELKKSIPIIVTPEDLDTNYLKKYHKIEEKKIHEIDKIGVINGLWANALGKGGIIPIECVYFPSSTFLDLKLTGLQGDVMKESMNVAKSLAWNLTDKERKKSLLLEYDNMKSYGIHIHCPEGAVSKDGPSAGTAITTVIYSLLNNKKIKNTIAITGEINLQGEVTAIGGLESKILGGIRAGVKTFLYPKSNNRDFTEFMNKYGKNSIITGIEFIEVGRIEEVFEKVFV